MNEPKRQHFVPEVYLRKFSVSKKGTDRVHCLYKERGEIFLQNIDKLAVQRDFYTIACGDDPYIVEKTYAHTIEPLLGDVLDTLNARSSNVLIQSNSVILDESLRADLAFMIVFQLLRGKQCRKFEEEMYVRNLSTALENGKRKFPQISSEKWDAIGKNFLEDKDYAKSLFIECSFDPKRIDQYASILFQRIFIVYKIIGELEFVTSDNPVMVINSVSYDPTPFSNGLLQVPTTVYYPISPKVLVASYHPLALFGRFSKEDGKLKFLDSDREQRFIRTLNRKQYEQCYDQVYSRCRGELDELINQFATK